MKPDKNGLYRIPINTHINCFSVLMDCDEIRQLYNTLKECETIMELENVLNWSKNKGGTDG